jgi:hypothetical protein
MVTNASASNKDIKLERIAFKNSSISKTTVVERNRIWLNLTNSGGAFKQLLVGYVTGATNGFDKLYDGTTMDSNPYVDFYSINGGKNLTIQGRALPFVITDEVPLGYKANIAGAFTISIDHVDGLFLTQDIFLKDLTTGGIYNLKNGAYSFTTEIGRFNDRFLLLYVDNTPPPAVVEEPIASEGTEPIVTDPVVAAPEAPAPDVVVPVVIEPEVTDPIVVVPEVPAPIVTEPEVTDPIVVVPEVPAPIVTEPEVTDPIVVVPEVPAPVVTELVVTDPIVVVPEVSAPIVTEPEVTDPIVVVPEVPAPIVTEPEVTDPIVVVPEVSSPIVTEPIVIVPEVPAPIVTNVKQNVGKGKAVFVSVNNSQVTIYSAEESITDVFVYTMGQMQLFVGKNINTNEFVIPSLGVVNQVLIIKTQLKNGKWSTNKIVL